MRLRRGFPVTSLAVQVSVVCTVLVVGLVPLTAPLPPMGGTRSLVAAAAGAALVISVAALGVMTLVPTWFRRRTRPRVMAAAAVGAVAAATGYVVTDGLITRPLLVIAMAALIVVAGSAARR